MDIDYNDDGLEAKEARSSSHINDKPCTTLWDRGRGLMGKTCRKYGNEEVEDREFGIELIKSPYPHLLSCSLVSFPTHQIVLCLSLLSRSILQVLNVGYGVVKGCRSYKRILSSVNLVIVPTEPLS